MRRSQYTPNSTLEVSATTPRRPGGDVTTHRVVWGHTHLLALLVVGVLLASTGSIAAEQPGTAAPSTASKLNPMNWKMPSFHMPEFLVPNNDQERIVQRKNTLVGDIKTTASKSWQRTKATFNPARLNPMNMFAGSAPEPGQKEKPGFFRSLLSPSPAEPEARVATVNEFLNQDRP